MKYIISIFVVILFLTACEEKEADAPKINYRPYVSDVPLYIGRFVYTDSTKQVIDALPYHKASVIYVEVGCECSDEVGEHITSQSSSKDTVQMYIAGDQLEFLKSIDKNFLQHLYFSYLYTDLGSTDQNHPRAKGGAIVQSSFYDLEDKVPLEKLTVYTMGKSNSIITVGKNAPAKAPAVDTTRVKVGKDTIVVQKDSARRR